MRIPYIVISNQLFFFVLSIIGLYYFFPYTTPFLIALVIAVLLESIVTPLITVIKLPRTYAVIIAFTIFILAVSGIIVLGVTKITFETIALMRELPVYLVIFQEQFIGLLNQGQLIYKGLPPETLETLNSTLSSAVNEVNGFLKQLLGFLLGLASALPKAFIWRLVVFISIFLISLGLPKLKEQFLVNFEQSAQEKVTVILGDLNLAIIGFVRAQIILSFLTYLISLIGLLFLDIKYALSIAFLITLVDILPILGTGSVIVPWAVFLLIQENTTTALGLLVLYAVLIIFRRIAEPKILGRNIGISALATIASLWIGFELLGVSGLFLGPIFVIIFQAVRRAGLLNKKISF
jgi:sporulation integral membrane protein YtvI